ncbi:MAG: TIGR00341 family protein [Planctomycetes bacterium]|nr:TIGR00341 family protein [Planctomycetota bacterium]
MALRRIEILGPVAYREHLVQLVRACDPVSSWTQCDAESCEVRALLESGRVEPLMNDLESFLALHEDAAIQVAVLDVKAILPRLPKPEETKNDAGTRLPKRISRDELSTEIYKGAEFDAIYVVTVILSTIVAAIGLLRNSPATVIGAMVIAPLMGPNVALALATNLGDGELARRALRTSMIGLATAVTSAALIALFLPPIDPEVPGEIHARVVPHWSDVILALASGVAGALAYTTGVSSSLVGVMVAVALLPPTVVATMLAVQGNDAAVNAGLLVATNIVGVILAAVTTFRIQGIYPRTWWDKKRTKRATVWALSFLFALLAVFTALLVLRAR